MQRIPQQALPLYETGCPTPGSVDMLSRLKVQNALWNPKYENYTAIKPTPLLICLLTYIVSGFTCYTATSIQKIGLSKTSYI
jgi:hypothetical protein